MSWHIVRWNPKYFEWDSIHSDINLLKSGADLGVTWQCRGPNCIKNGNCFFLVRQGEEPKGIMGCGHIKSCARGKGGCIVFEAHFDILLPPDKDKMLTRDYLKYMFPYVHWDTPKTGTLIDDDVAEILYNELIRKMKKPEPRSMPLFNYSFSAAQKAC